MTISPSEYEKLGAFYLGREYDVEAKEMTESLLMYDSKDLVTHGVVLGMTGSGKTGLCLALLEEAAIDRVPALIIDPKGDIANLLLTFPDLAGSDFRPWINEEDAHRKGKTPDEFAAAQAELWKKGLGEWGQSGDRIRMLRETVDITVFTPGSTAGVPVSILASLGAPEEEVLDDSESYSDRIASTASSILG
ncbi:MAG: helicase HerA domain-containing protein, partial [Verrucomicrobiota bacterium]